MSRNPVNDDTEEIKVIQPQYKEKVKQIEEARDDIEREREKFRRAFNKSKGGNKDDKDLDDDADLEKGNHDKSPKTIDDIKTDNTHKQASSQQVHGP